LEKYREYGIKISSDFEIRKVYEDDQDLDLFLALDNRPLNLELDGLPNYIEGRLQMNSVGNLLIRLAKDQNNSLGTVHFLKNIDLNSSVLNFVIDYKDLDIVIEAREFKNILRIGKVY